MTYKEEHRDLFSVSSDYYLAHCISADFGMGKGIVVEFNRRYDMKNILTSKYINRVEVWDNLVQGECLLEGRVFNLITKRNYWLKPTYETLTLALESMKEQIITLGIKKLAIPLIGCGLDGLDWNKVKLLILDVFQDSDIDILVCIK